jgi:hypothetical protein
MLDHVDERSRLRLRVFAAQVAFLSLIGVPALLVDNHAPTLFLLELRTMFTLSASVLLVFGILSRQRLSPGSLCIWDHIAGFLLLKTGCSVALRLIA